MILYNIELETDFHDFLMENIKEAREFALQNSDLICFITISKAKKDDPDFYSGCSFCAFLNYNPKYITYTLSGYGSHGLEISETEYSNLERLYKSLIRNNNIDSVFEN